MSFRRNNLSNLGGRVYCLFLLVGGFAFEMGWFFWEFGFFRGVGMWGVEGVVMWL